MSRSYARTDQDTALHPSRREAFEPDPHGRRPPVRDIKPNLRVPDLQEIVLEVIESVVTKERAGGPGPGRPLASPAGPSLPHPGQPHRRRGDGLHRHRSHGKTPGLRAGSTAHRDYAEALVETVRESLVVLDEGPLRPHGKQLLLSQVPGTPLQTEGKPLRALELGGAGPPPFQALEEVVARPEPLQDLEPGLAMKGLGERTLLFNARRVRLPASPGLYPHGDRRHHGAQGGRREPRASEVRYRRIFESAREGIRSWTANPGRFSTPTRTSSTCWDSRARSSSAGCPGTSGSPGTRGPPARLQRGR